jgi:hypothetical protein
MVTPHELITLVGQTQQAESHQRRLAEIDPALTFCFQKRIQPLVLLAYAAPVFLGNR